MGEHCSVCHPLPHPRSNSVSSIYWARTTAWPCAQRFFSWTISSALHNPRRIVLLVFSFYKEVKQFPKSTQRVRAGWWNLNSRLSSWSQGSNHMLHPVKPQICSTRHHPSSVLPKLSGRSLLFKQYSSEVSVLGRPPPYISRQSNKSSYLMKIYPVPDPSHTTTLTPWSELRLPMLVLFPLSREGNWDSDRRGSASEVIRVSAESWTQA